MAKTKRLKTVRAGQLVYAVCYDQPMPRDEVRCRREKSKVSTLARQKMNFRYAWQKLRLLLCANFSSRDLWVTLTYDDDHLPANRKEAKKEVTAFLDRLRYHRRRQGLELKYVYSTHELQEDGSRRLHHHMVISAGGNGDDFRLIRSLWIAGDNIEICTLHEAEISHGDDFLELAQYMLHERNPEATEHATGDRGWCGSRNLTKPESSSEMVDSGTVIAVPKEAVILERETRQNEFGSFEYVCFMLPELTSEEGPLFSVSG